MSLHSYARIETRFLIVLMTFFTLYAAYSIDEIIALGPDGTLLDPMKTSGYLVALFGIWLSLFLDRQFARLTRQIEHDGTIPWDAGNTQDMLRRRVRYSLLVGSLVAAVIFFGFCIFHFGGLPPSAPAWEFLISSVLLGAIAGHRLGAGAAYGQIARRAARPETKLKLILGHTDNFAGSRRLGEFIAYQGVLISIPIAWLAIWIVLERSHPSFAPRYGHWLVTHTVLMLIALTISWFNFIRPLLAFSSKFRMQKDAALAKWRDISKSELSAAQRNLRFASNVDEANQSLEEVARITAFSERLFALPEVPLRSSVTGVFSVATLFPVATFVLDILLRNTGLSSVLTPAFKVLGKLLGVGA